MPPVLSRPAIIISIAALACACTPPKPDEKQAPVVEHAAPEAPVPSIADTPPPLASAAVDIVRAEDLPPAADDAVTVNGWGRIRIGMTLDELNAALGASFDLSQDPQYLDYQCQYVDPKGAPGDLSVMVVDNVVRRVDVGKPGAVTYGGLQVGDPASKARSVFGGGLSAQPHFYQGLPSEYLTVWTAGGPSTHQAGPMSPQEIAALLAARGIRFETKDDGTIERFYAGDGAIEAPEGCQ